MYIFLLSGLIFTLGSKSMNGLRGGISRICLVASNTLLEAVRQKFFTFTALLCLALIAGVHFFRQFHFDQDSSGAKFIVDLGFGSIFFFGSILSIVTTVQLFFSEIENRTVLTLLAKPISHFEFIFGKAKGVFCVMLSFTVVMTSVLAIFIFWYQSTLFSMSQDLSTAAKTVKYSDIFIYGFILWLRFGVLCSLTMLIASFSSTFLYSVFVSFFVMIICQLQYMARGFWSVLTYFFPDFQVFNAGDLFASGESLEWSIVFHITLYAFAYMLIYNVLAAYSFKTREI
jgi:ABC-2 type transport system permease protein